MCIPVRCSLHSGELKGAIVGSTFLRYEVWGEGMQTAIRLLDLCLEGDVVISGATLELLRDRVEAVPLFQEETFCASPQQAGTATTAGFASARVLVAFCC